MSYIYILILYKHSKNCIMRVGIKMIKNLVRKGLVVAIVIILIGINTYSAGKIEMKAESMSHFIKESLLSDDVPEVEWIKQLGGENTEIGIKSKQTSEGGFILVGGYSSYYSFPQSLLLHQLNKDISAQTLLMKNDVDGDEEWSKIFGGPPQSYNLCPSIEVDSDGGYVLAGETNYFTQSPPWSDVWMVKTNAIGDHLWNKTFGGPRDDFGHSMKKTSDDGFIITGGCYDINAETYKVLLLKIDAYGNEQWSRMFGSSSYFQFGFDVDTTDDGGYVIIGGRTSFRGESIVLIKTDSLGQQEWDKTYQPGEESYGLCVKQTTDGGYIIAGNIISGRNKDQFQSEEAFLIKTDASGNSQWSRSYPGALIIEYLGDSVIQTLDGGFLLAGCKWIDYTEMCDGWCVRTYADGNTKWEKNIDYQTIDFFASVLKTEDGGYLLTGGTSPSFYSPFDVLLVKLESEDEPPDLEIDITGGLGVNAVITNNGSADAADVNWELHVDGGIFGMINKNVNGTIDIIPTGKSKTVGTGLFLGFGGIQINAKVLETEKIVVGTQLIFFTIIN